MRQREVSVAVAEAQRVYAKDAEQGIRMLSDIAARSGAPHLKLLLGHLHFERGSLEVAGIVLRTIMIQTRYCNVVHVMKTG